MPTRRVVAFAVVSLAVLQAGCATARRAVPVPIPRYVPADQTKCKVSASQSSPLVTEWPASEKANLEVLLRRGAVAVAYSGCTMRVLPECQLRGGYLWLRTTPAMDSFEITNADELYAKLPLGAASLEGELKLSGRLSVQTHVAGQLRLDGLGPADVPRDGACAAATHLISGLSVGAFTLTRGGGASVGGGASLEVVSAGGKVSQEVAVVRSAGDAQACGEATDQAPNPNCRSPVQVFLAPLPGRAGVEEEGPPGMVKVEMVSAAADSRWDVYMDDEVICSTPCTRWLDPHRPLLLRAREQRYGFADKLWLRGLGAYDNVGPVQIQAHPTAKGEMATGISFAGVGGMAVAMGGMLSLTGCALDTSHAGLCNAGLISIGAGALVAAGGAWLILDALPKVEIVPAYGEDGVAVQLGPGIVSGRF